MLFQSNNIQSNEILFRWRCKLADEDSLKTNLNKLSSLLKWKFALSGGKDIDNTYLYLECLKIVKETSQL